MITSPLLISPTFDELDSETQEINMASGIEIAGLTLAVLPLLVKRLDDYATGLAILKSFRTRTYRREMDAYRANLGTQSANLRNAIITLIEDVLEDDIETPTAKMLEKGEWLAPLQRGKIDQRLRQCLDIDYDIFVANLQSLSFMVMDLRHKLNLDGESQPQVSSLCRTLIKMPSSCGRYDNAFRTSGHLEKMRGLLSAY